MQICLPSKYSSSFYSRNNQKSYEGGRWRSEVMFKRARTQKSRGRGSNFPLIAESTISFWGLSKTRTSLKKSDGFPFPDCTEPPSEVAGGCGGHPNHSFFPFLKNSLERVGIVLAQVGGCPPLSPGVQGRPRAARFRHG